MFGKATSMQINFSKLKFSFFSLEDDDAHYIQGVFPFALTLCDEGLKYFGFHLNQNSYMKLD